MGVFTGSGYDKTKLISLLKEAQDAYHDLLTGKKAVKVERDGRMVEFTKVSQTKLSAYITELQTAIDPKNGGRNRRPARFVF